MRIAYLMSRFPKISETFILREMLLLQELGANVLVFPLKHEREEIAHTEVRKLADSVCRDGILSRRAIASHFFWLRRTPGRYLAICASAVLGNIMSPRFLLASIFTFVRAAHWARIALDENIACIHAHWATHPALGAYIMHRLTGIPYGFTAHAHDIYVRRPMLREKIGRAAYVVTISEYNRRLLESLYGRKTCERLRVIRLGVDLSSFLPTTKRPDTGPFRILCVASLEEYKGHRHLIAACGLLRDRAVPFLCHCIGDGSARGEIERSIHENGLEDSVILLGRRPWQDVRAYLGEAHCAVLPSVVAPDGRREGIPVALMEAMAMSVPVVATDISGIPELVEDGREGLLVPPADARALADAIARLNAAPRFAFEMGEAGRRKVLRDYDLRRNVVRIHELQRACASRGHQNNRTIAIR